MQPESKLPAIDVRNLTLNYKANISRKPNIKEALLHLGRRERLAVEVCALKDVSFEVMPGTVLGIVGANGAGKSTLMKAIAGILPPTDGEIRIRGAVSAMLSLGVGFNANLSGRENVFLGGLAAGLSREEIEEQFTEIVEFSGLMEEIDRPMRTYSSGMYGRLGFAVATTVKPEILLIDEALSAGDAAFKEKSSQRIKDLCQKSKTLLIVSHGLGTIEELCTDAIWLHKGILNRRSDPHTIVHEYTEFLNVGEVPSVMEDF